LYAIAIDAPVLERMPLSYPRKFKGLLALAFHQFICKESSVNTIYFGGGIK
jgi:hypothetical protein